MYSDPAKLRVNVVKVRFSDEEAALVEAFVNYTGEQKATLLRGLILEEAVRALGIHGGGSSTGMLVPLQAAV